LIVIPFAFWGGFACGAVAFCLLGAIMATYQFPPWGKP
jgi:hypothetical protein